MATAIVDAFVHGINAYIAETERHPALLTPNFNARNQARQMDPAIVISRFNGLAGNVEEELDFALQIRADGVERARSRLLPARQSESDLDPAIDAALLSPDVLSLYMAFRSPLHFTADEFVAKYRSPSADRSRSSQSSTRPRKPHRTSWAGPVKISAATTGWWAATHCQRISTVGQRPASLPGSALLALPGAPGRAGMERPGRGRPSLPGISIGHNQYGAWGLTIFGTDTEDLFVYDTNPENPSQYKYRGPGSR